MKIQCLTISLNSLNNQWDVHLLNLFVGWHAIMQILSRLVLLKWVHSRNRQQLRLFCLRRRGKELVVRLDRSCLHWIFRTLYSSYFIYFFYCCPECLSIIYGYLQGTFATHWKIHDATFFTYLPNFILFRLLLASKYLTHFIYLLLSAQSIYLFGPFLPFAQGA